MIQYPSENMCMFLLLKAALGMEREEEPVGPLWCPLFKKRRKKEKAAPLSSRRPTQRARELLGARKASEKMYYLSCEAKLCESQKAKSGSGCTSSKTCQSERVLVSIFNSTRVCTAVNKYGAWPSFSHTPARVSVTLTSYEDGLELMKNPASQNVMILRSMCFLKK